MFALLMWVSGMFAGAIIVLLFGAMASASQHDQREEQKEWDDAQHAYIVELERQLRNFWVEDDK